ncbi:MAG: helix-turn-helix transcriptional regulator [Fimbriimonadales bacterium]
MNRLKQLRTSRGLPVDAFAHIAGVSPRTVVLWERFGLAPKRRDTVERIARALGVEPDFLLNDADTQGGEVQL